MNHASLFSGIGGFDLAADWMGWNNLFHCEWNEFGKQVLQYYWPKAKSYDDITKTDFTIWKGRIDILTGGFPCQPYSVAGKRKGKDDERHLWPEMLRAIREIQPRWVVGENVSGIITWNAGLVFEEVQADLEAEGYEVQTYILPAASVNAPHKRDRVWFVAYRANTRNETVCKPTIKPDGFKPSANSASKQGERIQSEQHETCVQKQRESRRSDCPNYCTREVYFDGESVKMCKCGHGDFSFITDANRRRQSGKKHRQTQSGFFTKKSVPDNWENFPTQSPICNGNDGISTRLDGITFPKWRNESIKAGGNAIVPQVVLQIFKAIELYETSNNKSI